jgi:carbon storage regulator
VLVLTRKVGEQVHIGDNIVVTIVALEGGKVRVGIDAPRELPIMRQELLRQPAEPAPTPPVNPTALANPCLIVPATQPEGPSLS